MRKQASDKSEHFPRYVMTRDYNWICISEYAPRVATSTSVHVVELNACKLLPFPTEYEHELVLKQRSGRSRHFYFEGDESSIVAASNAIMNEPYRSGVQLPYQFAQAGIK